MLQIQIINGWPEAISDGLTLPCSICDHLPKFDYLVEGDLWHEVVPEEFKRGVICLGCLDKLASEKGWDIASYLSRIHFTGIGKTIVLHPDRVYYYKGESTEGKTARERIKEIRNEIETKHKDSNGGGGFGETFCAHIHTYNIGFVDLARHFNITLAELAEVTADHIRRLEPAALSKETPEDT